MAAQNACLYKRAGQLVSRRRIRRKFLDALTRARHKPRQVYGKAQIGAVHPFVIGEYRSGITRTRGLSAEPIKI